MHRPFFKILHRGPNNIDYDPDGKDIHSRSCKAAAIKIANILRIFKNNYTHRCFPVSAVHPAFTAAIIHLLDYKTSQADNRKSAFQRLRICIECLYGMNVNWDWANRSIRAIHYLSAQWDLNIQDLNIDAIISEENRIQFERYEVSCIAMGATPNLAMETQACYPDIPFDGVSGPWSYGYDFFAGAFDLFDEY